MKRMIKRLLSILLIFFIISTITIGCSNKETSEATQQSNENTSEEENQEKEDDEVVAEFTYLSEDSINAENAMEIIEELASEKYDGRLAGTEGNNLAVDYIASYFKEIGLESPDNLKEHLQYFTQNIRMVNSTPTLELIDKNGNVISDYKYLEDFRTYTYHTAFKLQGEIEGEIYEVKNGSEINSSNTELKNKILMINQSVVQDYEGDFYSDVSNPEMKIKGVLINNNVSANAIVNQYSFRESTATHYIGEENNNPLIYAGSNIETYNEILEKAKEGAVVRIRTDFSFEEVEVANIIGLIPGTDEELKDEYIIICGHMDHLGSIKDGTFYPGALDNASGTAALMEVARVLTESEIKPKKSIIFIAFNAEEEGLWGSKYYVDNPIYSLDKTTVINLDMVGSKANILLELADPKSSAITKRLGDYSVITKRLGEYCKVLGIKYKYSLRSDSDHVSFIDKGVEAVQLTHFDPENKHTPTDTIKSIDKDRMKEVIKLILFYLDKNAY